MPPIVKLTHIMCQKERGGNAQEILEPHKAKILKGYTHNMRKKKK